MKWQKNKRDLPIDLNHFILLFVWLPLRKSKVNVTGEIDWQKRDQCLIFEVFIRFIYQRKEFKITRVDLSNGMFVNDVYGVLKTLMISKVLYPLKLIAIIEKYPNKMG